MSGFQLFGSNGNIQLDVSNKPLVLVQKGTVLVTDGSRPPGNTDPIPSFGYMATVAYGNSSARPIMVFQSPVAHIGIVSAKLDSFGTFNWSLKGVDKTGSTSSWNINYWIFDSITMTETHAGLNLYDNSGNVVYSSDYKLLRVVGIADSPNTFLRDSSTGIDNGGSMSAPVGNYGAFLAGARFHHDQSVGTFTSANYREGVRTSSTGMTTGSVFLVGTKGSAVYKSTSSKMFLVNVDNY